MEPVAVLVLYTLTEESNFRHKLYSWITVSPGRVVKKKKALSSHSLFPEPGSGTGSGLVPWHRLQGRRDRLPVQPHWWGQPCSPDIELDLKTPFPRQKSPLAAAVQYAALGRRWQWLWHAARPQSPSPTAPQQLPPSRMQIPTGSMGAKGQGPLCSFPDGHGPSVPNLSLTFQQSRSAALRL